MPQHQQNIRRRKARAKAARADATILPLFGFLAAITLLCSILLLTSP